MKVLQVVDIFEWAIGGLANTIEKQNPHLDIKTIAIHPKDLRNNAETQIGIFENEVKTFQPDIIHFHYWDVAHKLSKLSICKRSKVILTHHNQKNLLTHEWDNIDVLVTHTQKAKSILEGAGYWNVDVIQHGIDIEHFKYRENYELNEKIGYVGRICGWKGLVGIAKAAKEQGKKVICMGRIDKADYWKECLKYKDVLDIRFGTPDDEQVGVYHEMDCYLGNSCDTVEEGTLGLLEAMACGIPVITTPSGEAKDIIKDGENGILIDFEDDKSLADGMRKFYKLREKEKNKMRENAWNTVRLMSREVMARKYEKLYYKTLTNDDLVSVIIPTYNRAKSITKMLDAYERQSYSPIELIVVDDNSTDNTKEVIFEWASKHRNVPVKYLNTERDGYGLAKARNMGIFEASGNYIIFNDDRMIPDPMSTWVFVSNIKARKNRAVVWGDKGAGKRDFIENFFIIRKQDIVDIGMFNERINEYGGQSQELRERMRNLKYDLQFEVGAKATPAFGTKKAPRRYQLFRTKTKLWKLRR